MPDAFVAILLGHLVGDFMLQSKHMALTKFDRAWSGFAMCTLHVAIYTATVCVFVWTINPVFIAAVAVPHWLIDQLLAGLVLAEADSRADVRVRVSFDRQVP
ncbi:MAG: hypothetical protein JWN71_5071 [Xanthobacteraceae bacterium]|jgi:hypothetical protein|nr:hypothetical protein [Xanthobacteraceae bacterium]